MVLPSAKCTTWAFPNWFFGAQSLASAYGLLSSYLRLIQLVTSLYSRLGAGQIGRPYPGRHFRRQVIKAPRGAHISILEKGDIIILCLQIKIFRFVF